MGDVHTSLCKISNDNKLWLWEGRNGNLTCLPRVQEWKKQEFKFQRLLYSNNLLGIQINQSKNGRVNGRSEMSMMGELKFFLGI